MRYGIFGDIHANLEALEAVFAAMAEERLDECICLGDIVGYGADPEVCVDRVRESGALVIAGNHDHAVFGAQELSYFNHHAREAVLWTQSRLSDESKAWLRSLSLVEHLEGFSVVHGSLHQPESFNYVQTLKDAETNFRLMPRPLLFLGHSHYPFAFFDTEPMTYTLEASIPADPRINSVVNVGSVGQPRDENNRACFAVYDDIKQEVVLRRIVYDIDKTKEKILAAGLPHALAERLSYGK